MTLPNERYRALVYTRDFLRDLLDPKVTPRVPKKVRKLAGDLLRHFPWDYDLEQLPKKLPKHFGTWDGKVPSGKPRSRK